MLSALKTGCFADPIRYQQQSDQFPRTGFLTHLIIGEEVRETWMGRETGHIFILGFRSTGSWRKQAEKTKKCRGGSGLLLAASEMSGISANQMEQAKRGPAFAA